MGAGGARPAAAGLAQRHRAGFLERISWKRRPRAFGLAIGRQPMLARFLAEGRVTAPFGDRDRSGCAYYLVYPDDVELNVSARRVARWLTGLAEGSGLGSVVQAFNATR